MLPFHILARKALIVGIDQVWPFLFASSVAHCLIQGLAHSLGAYRVYKDFVNV